MYGLLISTAILINILLAEKLIKKDHKNPEILWELATISVLFGILGARIYHVIDYGQYYQSNLVQILYLWNGGLGIFGAIIGGAASAYVYLKIKKQDFWYYISTIIIFLPLSQAIGRWGNYFNQEIVGTTTNLPWGMYLNGIKYHPIFLYESILNLILFIILITLKTTKNLEPKKIIGVYLGGYGLIRFLLEFIRPNSWSVYNTNIAQLVSIIFLTISYILITRKKSVQ